MIVELLLGGPAATTAERYTRSGEGAAPDLLNAEVLHGIRARERLGALPADRASEAVDDLLSLPITRYPTFRLIDRVWRLRHNFSSYDAMYVALAEAVDGPLVTADARLARAVEAHTGVEAVLLT